MVTRGAQAGEAGHGSGEDSQLDAEPQSYQQSLGASDVPGKQQKAQFVDVSAYQAEPLASGQFKFSNSLLELHKSVGFRRLFGVRNLDDKSLGAPICASPGRPRVRSYSTFELDSRRPNTTPADKPA